MPARSSRSAIQRGDGPTADVVEHRHREAGAEVGRCHRRRRRRLDRPPARCRLGRLGRGERKPESPRQVAGDPDHGPGVGAVALDRDVEDDVGLQPERLHEWRARLTRRLVAQDQQAGAVVGQPELLARAQHPVGLDTTQRAPRDLGAVRKDGADRGEGDAVPQREVVRAAHDLELVRAGVHHDPPDAVGPLDGADLGHPADHDVAQALARRARPPRRRDPGRRARRAAPRCRRGRERSHGAS